MPSLAKNKSKSLKPKKVALKNGHKNGAKNGFKVSAKVSGKTAILKKAGKRTYFFGGGKAEGTKEMKNLLGGKGANLAEMTNIGVPVPPGFTITTDNCTAFYAAGRKLPSGLVVMPEASVSWRSPRPSGRMAKICPPLGLASSGSQLDWNTTVWVTGSCVTSWIAHPGGGPN